MRYRLEQDVVGLLSSYDQEDFFSFLTYIYVLNSKYIASLL